MSSAGSRPEEERALGLRENWRQFWLLVLVNAFAGYLAVAFAAIGDVAHPRWRGSADGHDAKADDPGRCGRAGGVRV